MARSGSKLRLLDFVVALVLFAMLLGGGWYAYKSNQTYASPPAPLPADEFSNSNAKAKEAGPVIPDDRINPPNKLDPNAVLVPMGMQVSLAEQRAVEARARKHDWGPGTIVVPALGAYAPYSRYSISNGMLGLPDDVKKVGVYDNKVTATSKEGTFLFAGHVDNRHQGPGALHDMYRAQPDMLVITTDFNNKKHFWRVDTKRAYHKQGLPQDVFRADGPHRLVMVTCGGAVLGTAGNAYYEDNVVVGAKPE